MELHKEIEALFVAETALILLSSPVHDAKPVLLREGY